MKKLSLCLCSIVLVLVFGSTSEPRRTSNSPRPIACILKQRPAARHHAAPHIRLREGASLNWSGYAAVEGSLGSPTRDVVTTVAGSWTVPSVTGSGNWYSSLWVGIDGYADGSVEQIGTEQDVVTGRHHRISQRNFTWFEMYPGGLYEIVGFPSYVGDVIGAGVAYDGGSSFTLAITNVTRGVYYVVPSSYTMSSSAQRSSAEWIAEAPSSNGGVLPLADFGTVTFTGCSATINGTNGPISDFTYDSLTMETSTGVPKAVPSGLSRGGSSFTLTWKHY